jgi:hypothetical protein
LMERNKIEDAGESGAEPGEANIVESGGETTAAATGPAEIGASLGETVDNSNARPVGADTLVRVAGEPDSTES